MAQANEFIYIHHPDIAVLGGPVTREALEVLYTDKGWSEATPDQVEAHEIALGIRTADDEGVPVVADEVVEPDPDEVIDPDDEVVEPDPEPEATPKRR